MTSRIALVEGTAADAAKLNDCRLRAVREVGVAVAELLRQVEAQPLGELDGARDRSAVLRETLHHLGRRKQNALVIATPLGLATVEPAAVPNGDQDVLQRRAAPMVRMDVAGDDRRDAELLGETAEGGVVARVAALVRSLELDEEAVRSEGTCQTRGAVRIAHRYSVPRAPGKTHEPVV